MKGVDYASGKTPKDYRCTDCGATNCKLWRPAQNSKPLLCVFCAQRESEISVAVDAVGKSEANGLHTDNLGWYLPAVPDEEDISFWGYSSVPMAGVNWWKQLPTLPAKRGAR